MITKERLKKAAFILIAMGTVGLLVREFAFDGGRGDWPAAASIFFACLTVSGFASLAYSRWGLR